MQKPRVLVADQDSDFLQALQQGCTQLDLVSATDQKNAQLKIADHKSQYSAICLNLNLCSPFALPLVRFVKSHRPAAPLYLLTDGSPSPFQKDELSALHVQDLIQKPVSPSDLFQRLIPGSYFNLAEALEVAKVETAKTGETREAADESMHAIDAKSFLCGQKSFFDLYVRLGSGKFVMIVKAGDIFEPARVASYLAKGVTEFYIRREAQLYYLQYCEKLTESLIQSDKISTTTKVAQVLNLGGETFSYLKSAGISESTLMLAQGFVTQANFLVKKTGLGKLNEVQAFLENADLSDHGASCVMITSMMVKSMGFEDEKVTGLIALGAFLHDVGKLSLPESIRVKEESGEAFTEEEQAQYERHPALGAAILQKVLHINPLVPQIALQHHERRTRKGFPNKLGSGAISTAAEIVGLADLFLKILKHEPEADPLERVRKGHADGFSLKTIDAFMKAFKR